MPKYLTFLLILSSLILTACDGGGKNSPDSKAGKEFEKSLNDQAGVTEPEEESFSDDELATSTGIPAEIFTLIREKSDAPMLPKKPEELWIKGQDEPGATNLPGLELKVNQDEAPALVRELAMDLNPKGYQVYHSAMNYGYSPDRISIIKSSEPFSILEMEGTNGVNWDLYTADIIQKLKGWDEKYGLTITGADFDWLEADFKTPPEDMQAFAEEVYEFCPDVVDQGSGSVEALAQEMEYRNSVYLWWD